MTGAHVWQEPALGDYPDPSVLGLSGHERMQALATGQVPVPPLTRLTGARLDAIGDGTATATMPLSGWLACASGVITGGTLAILADIGFGCAIESKLPPATPYTTAELSLSYLRPTWPGDRCLSANGQSIHVGRRVGLSEVFLIEEGSDRLIAHGTSRCAILPRIADVPEPPVAGDEGREASDESASAIDPFERPAEGEVLDQAVWADLGGRRIMDGLISGELPRPPIAALTGLMPTEAGDGTATAVLPCSEWLASPLRTVQGGLTAMLADAALLFAVQTTVEPGTAYAGLDLKVNYLRPVFPDGKDLVARAEVVNRGRSLAIARAEVTTSEGKRVALATGSSILLPGQPASLGDLELSGE
ncbi:MAG: PaaI family thioesterase [Solirubrobacterales bacterium]